MWISFANIESGSQSYEESIVRAINSSHAFVLFVSKNSMESVDVNHEILNAGRKQLRALIIRFDETELTEKAKYYYGSTQVYQASDPDIWKTIFDFTNKCISNNEYSTNKTSGLHKINSFYKLVKKWSLTTLRFVALLGLLAFGLVGTIFIIGRGSSGPAKLPDDDNWIKETRAAPPASASPVITSDPALGSPPPPRSVTPPPISTRVTPQPPPGSVESEPAPLPAPPAPAPQIPQRADLADLSPPLTLEIEKFWRTALPVTRQVRLGPPTTNLIRLEQGRFAEMSLSFHRNMRSFDGVDCTLHAPKTAFQTCAWKLVGQTLEITPTADLPRAVRLRIKPNGENFMGADNFTLEIDYGDLRMTGIIIR